MSILSNRRRVLVALGISATCQMITPTAAAWAHVSIEPDIAPAGGYAREAFHVPNERDDATTVKLEVTFPVDHPLVAVSVQPVPGWTTIVKKKALPTAVKTDEGEITEAVSSITWSGGSIGAGQFQDFPVSLGALPDAGTRLVFKVLQTYSDGEIVRWIEAPNDDGQESEDPAPTITVASATAAHPVQKGDSDAFAVTLGAAGLLAGLAGLGVSLTRRTPRLTESVPAPSDTPSVREPVPT